MTQNIIAGQKAEFERIRIKNGRGGFCHSTGDKNSYITPDL